MNSPDIVIKGRHIDLSSRFREHAGEKLGRVGKFGLELQQIDVEVSKETNPRLADRAFEVELTCRGKGPVIRAEAAAADKYSALDQAYSRLEERLRRLADRNRFHRHGRATTRLADAFRGKFGLTSSQANGSTQTTPPAATEANLDERQTGPTSDGTSPETTGTVFEAGPLVVREKIHQAEPMTIEQALTEMELVGHDFFLFYEIESGRPAVVYRRRGYDYGLIRVDTPANVS